MAKDASTKGEAKGRYVLLLRGINVGGSNKLAMRDLSRLCERAGATNVVTYIQSGNVVLSAPPPTAEALHHRVASLIREELGLTVPVVLRTAREFAAVAKRHACAPPSSEAKALYVAFLAAAPSAATIARLDPARSPGDVFALKGRELFLCLAAGAGKTKLTNDYFERTLGTTSTIRNWNTVQKLAALVTRDG